MFGLQRAIAHFHTQTALARALGLRPMTVAQWMVRGVPAERVLSIAEATDFAVTPHEIRPDLYPNPSDGLPAHSPRAAVA